MNEYQRNWWKQHIESGKRRIDGNLWKLHKNVFGWMDVEIKKWTRKKKGGFWERL